MGMMTQTPPMAASGQCKWAAAGPAPEQWLGGGPGWWPGRVSLLLQDLEATQDAAPAPAGPHGHDLLRALQGLR